MRGGHLASVHDIQQNQHLNLIVQTDGFPLWIGLSNQDVRPLRAGFSVTAPFDLDLILSVSQVSGSAYEWSDGTKFDYDISISDPLVSYISGTPGPTCVFIAPGGAWIRASCSIAVDGAICYNTTVTTDSQSKMLSPLDFRQEAQHC